MTLKSDPQRLDIHVWLHQEPDPRIGEVLTRLRSIQRNQGAIMADLSALQAEVEENGTVDQSAIALLEGLSQMLRDAADDPAAVNALAAQLDASNAALAAAVAANTPAVEPPPPGE